MNNLEPNLKLLLDQLDKASLIEELNQKIIPPDELPFFLYKLKLNPIDKYSDGNSIESLSGNGCSIVSPGESLIKCLSEAIERFSTCNYLNQNVQFSSFQKLGPKAIDPYSLTSNLKTRDQLAGWVTGESLLDKKTIYLPAQSVYLNFKNSKVKPMLFESTSTGAAASFSSESAILNGIYELVERDAFLTNYLNSVPALSINPASIKDSVVKKYLKSSKQYQLSIRFLDITNDLQIPTILCLITDKLSYMPPIVCGLKTSFNLNQALRGALAEALMVRFWVRNLLFSRGGPIVKIEHNKIKTAQDRALYWAYPKRMNHLKFWFTGQKKNLASEKLLSTRSQLQKVKNIFKSKKIAIFYKDISTDLFRDQGHHVYKIIIPSLQAFYMSEKYKVISQERLNNVAEYFKLPKNKFNQIPHPML